jgi:hypothetical protein
VHFFERLGARGNNRELHPPVLERRPQDSPIFEAKQRKGSKRRSKRDLARRGAGSEKFDCVLFDESHALKNLNAIRSKFAIKLYETAKMVLWLSATAGQNPLELGYLLPILAKKTGDRALTTKEFEQ